MHNGIVTAPRRSEPRTRACQGYGHRFIPDGDQTYCSGICAGNPRVTTLLVEARRLAAWQAYASSKTA